MAEGEMEGQTAPREGAAMGGRLLYRGSEVDMDLWCSGERMLAGGRTPVWSETRARVRKITTREAAVQQRIYADDGGLGREAGFGDVCCEEAAPAVGSKAAVGHGGADRVPKRAEERPEEESAERAMGA